LCPALPADVCRVPELPDEEPPLPSRPALEPGAPPATTTPRPGVPGGIQLVVPDPSEGFQRRTRKKPRR
jgi:hypothetical protein